MEMTERFAEFSATDIAYARVVVRVEDPDIGKSVTSSMLIDRRMLDDFIKERQARRLADQAYKNHDTESLRYVVTELQSAERQARDTRQVIAHTVARSLSDYYSRERT